MLVLGVCVTWFPYVFLHLFTGEGRLLWFPFGGGDGASEKKIKASGLNLHL